MIPAALPLVFLLTNPKVEHQLLDSTNISSGSDDDDEETSFKYYNGADFISTNFNQIVP